MTGRVRVWLAVAAACAASYAITLRAVDYIHDDRWLIADNAFLHQGVRAIPTLFTTGYWEAANGRGGPVQEYRPLLMTTFLFQYLATGPALPPMHAVNLLLHLAVCGLLWEILRSRLRPPAALAAALFFATIPIHTEAVSALTGRSEVLSAALMLGSWLCLQARGRVRPMPGAALFFAALLTKEHALLFPALLLLDDWTLRAPGPLGPERRRVYLPLAAAAALYLLLRRVVLEGAFRVGRSYFTGSTPLASALTVARFDVLHYLVPALTGVGLCTDYSRPLIPDSGPASPGSWICLLALAAVLAAAGWFLARRRSRWAFWILGPSLFLLPTSHLLVPIDTLGAERFLYFPSIGLAALVGALYARMKDRVRMAPALAGALLLWYAAQTLARNLIWVSGESYYTAAVACNPVSADARSALGTHRILRGDVAGGESDLALAARMSPRSPHASYNLARLAWERKDAAQAERLLRLSLASEPGSGDAWNLLALVVSSQGRNAESAEYLEKALRIRPWDASARFNLAREYQISGRPDLAAAQYELFLESAPDDPQAEEARRLVAALRSRPSPTRR